MIIFHQKYQHCLHLSSMFVSEKIKESGEDYRTGVIFTLTEALGMIKPFERLKKTTAIGNDMGCNDIYWRPL